MRVTYSKDADVLYISFVPPTDRVASSENANGDILRIDTSTGMIIGVTVQLFLYRISIGEKIEVPEIGLSLSSLIGTIRSQGLNVKAN